MVPKKSTLYAALWKCSAAPLPRPPEKSCLAPATRLVRVRVRVRVGVRVRIRVGVRVRG